MYPGLVLSSVYLMPEGLSALLVVTCIVVARHRAAALAVAAGAVTGLAILTRSVGLALLRGAPGRVAARATADAAPPVAGALADELSRCSLAACAAGAHAVAVLHARVAGGPLLDATSGVDLFAGNNPRATGRLEIPDEAVARHCLGSPANLAEANARAIGAGKNSARKHPRAWAGLGDHQGRVPVRIRRPRTRLGLQPTPTSRRDRPRHRRLEQGCC